MSTAPTALGLLTLALLPLAPRAAEEPAAGRLARVVLVGSSATYGYETETSLGEVWDATVTRDASPARVMGDLFFFTAPVLIGGELIDRALAEQPTLLVGVDLLFWYGYGANGPAGKLENEEQRLELLEVGLKLLERIPCPMVVGDFPDMSPAVGRILMPSQMPQRETLDKLNARLREWAEGHERVTVFPLAELIERMRADETFRIGRVEWPSEGLIQEDQLHPTSLGQVLLVHAVADLVAGAREDVADADFEWSPAAVCTQLGLPVPEILAEAGAEKAAVEPVEAGGGGAGTGGSDGR